MRNDGVPVREWLQKAEDDSVEPARPDAGSGEKKQNVLLLLSCASADDSAVSWVGDEMESELSAADVAAYHLGSMKVAPCAGCYAAGGRAFHAACERNDVESDVFSPGDAMPVLTEKLEACDAVVLVTDVRAGGVNHGVQRVLERLHPYRRPGDQRLRGKLVAGFFIGPSAAAIGRAVVGEFNALGLMSFGPIGTWELPHEVPQDDAKRIFKKSDALRGSIARVAATVIDVTKEKK